MASIGRGKVQRGIGKNGAGTSTRNPGSPGNYKRVSVSKNAAGGDSGRADPGKGRQPKNMGSSGEKSTNPKYGRNSGPKQY